MDRRTFLKSSLAGAAAVAPLAAKPAAAKKQPASDRVRIAVMGVRSRGLFLTRRFAGLGDVEIPYLCDVDQNVAGPAMKVVEETYGKRAKLVSDIRYVLDDKNIDAVVMGTPIHWHVPGAILACDAGKDVYVEKPISHNIREGRLLIEAVRRNKRVLQHGTQSRSRPVTERFVEYLQSGKIGKVLMVKASDVQKRPNIGHKKDEPVPPGIDYDIWTGPLPMMPFNRNRFHGTVNWHWHYGTGEMGNSGVHTIDVARWILGVDYPTEVTGMGRMLYFDDDQQTPDTQHITFHFKDKAIFYEQRIWNSYRMQGTEEGIFAYGTDGMAHMGRWVGGHWAFRVFDAKGKLTHYEQEATPENDTHARNFVDCIRSREKPTADVETGHISTVLCHLGNIVSRTGRNLRFDAKTETIVDDREANQYLRRDYREHWSKPKEA